MNLNHFDEAMNAIGIKPIYIGFDAPASAKAPRKKRKPHVRWDEPEGCASPRGWCYIEGLSITYDGQKPVGYYLVYSREPKPVFAMSYVFRNEPNGYGIGRREFKWFNSIYRAKRWVEKTAPTLV